VSPLQCADRFNPALGQATPAAKAAAKAKKVGGAFCFGIRTGQTRDNPNPLTPRSLRRVMDTPPWKLLYTRGEDPIMPGYSGYNRNTAGISYSLDTPGMPGYIPAAYSGYTRVTG
jgi:hypothetical protein